MAPHLYSPEDDLELLRSSAVAAGILAAGYFRRDVKSWTKDNATPVSEADLAVDKFLHTALLSARPDYGWLSEETADNADRLGKSRVFVVDPIDGTRGFLRGEDSWTVSVAVVEDGVPIAGVLYAPARDEMYDAVIGGGARLNGRPLLRTLAEPRLPLIPAPVAVHQELLYAGLQYSKGPYYPSLAYRLVQVATGRIEATVARRGAQDWDIAAASIIVWEAGHWCEDACIGRPVFNRPDVRHGALAAYADPSLKSVLNTALITVYGCPQPHDPPPLP